MTAYWSRPKVDCHLYKDDRSRQYPVRTIVQEANPDKMRFWPIPNMLPLDQGKEGECVGYGWSAELAVDPIEIPVHNQFAHHLFLGARTVDRKENRFYEEGATLLAGAKAAKAMGLISGYHWPFGINDVRDALINKGPVVIGINVYDGMFETEANGLVRINGSLAGGHCLLLTAYWPYRLKPNGREVKNNSPFGRTVYQWINSWGFTYGIAGRGYIAEDDLSRLLQENGEACIATDIAPKPQSNKLVRIARSVRRELRLN